MLPDPQIGSYRGARFHWSGIISSLQYQGHEYFGQWYKHHEPTIHDAVTEPLEEFRTNDSGLGYEEAKPGNAFVRIGIFADCRGMAEVDSFTRRIMGRRPMGWRTDGLGFR